MSTIAAGRVQTGKSQQRRPRGNGLVRFYTEPHRNTADKLFNAKAAIEVLESGLPFSELTELQQKLDVPADKLAPMLGISKATFHRQKQKGGKLDAAVSDRIVRFARLLGQAIRALGDLDNAKRWLCSPQFGLGGAVPLDYAKTELGAREVENLLGRIEYGVYS